MPVQRLNKAQVQQLIANDENVILLDVRQREELQEAKPLPKAKNVPLQEVSHAFSQLSNEDFKNKYSFEKPDKNQRLVVYCRSGMSIGYENLLHYSGIMDWYSN